MEYRGKYHYCDFDDIKTYPIAERRNKVGLQDLIRPEEVLKNKPNVDSPELRIVADEICRAARNKKPVVWMSGAHIIKNGLSPLLIDLMKRKIVTLVAGTGAFAIHDFELALQGETSENVPNALPEGKFGMAYETGRFMNEAIREGNKLKLGYGETLGMFIDGKLLNGPLDFKHPELSTLHQGYRLGIPVTVHVTIGADIIHQHPFFDGEATGGCSGRDFRIFACEISRFSNGGVFLNTGSAVTGPEVLLKAVSMNSNTGARPEGIITADFDIRKIAEEFSENELQQQYYYRDFKSIVSRIPAVFAGRGYYICGNHKETIPALYKLIVQKLEG